MTSRRVEFQTMIRLGLGRFPALVIAEISGRYAPSRWGPDGGTPEEWPDVDLIGVHLVDDDDVPRISVLSALSTEEITRLVGEALYNAADDDRDAAADAAERNADAKEDR